MLVIVVSVVALIAATIYWLKSTAPLPPLPVILPKECHCLFGHAALFELGIIEAMRRICNGNKETVDGVSCFYMMNKMSVSVTKADHVRAVFQASSYREKVPIVDKHLDMFLGRKSLVSIQNETWKKTRKVVTKAFHWEYLKNIVPHINKLTKKFIGQILSRDEDKPIEFYKASKCLTLDVIGVITFGYDFGCTNTLEPSPMASALEYLLSELDRRRFVNVLDPRSNFYWWPTESNRRYEECDSVIRSTISEQIELRKGRSTTTASNGQDLLAQLLRARKDDSSDMDDEALYDALITFVFAGYDTTSVLMTYLFYILATNKDIERVSLEEVHAVLGTDPNVLPTYDDLTTKFPYCTAVLNEILRLYPPVPLTSRNLVEPLTLSLSEPGVPPSDFRQITLPTGTMMYIPIWFIHREESNFPNPEEFDPHRFLGDQSAHQSPAFVPFSAGARDCVGRRLAMLEALTIFVNIVREISFETVDGYEFVPGSTGTLQRPKNLMPLKIRHRSAPIK